MNLELILIVTRNTLYVYIQKNRKEKKNKYTHLYIIDRDICARVRIISIYINIFKNYTQAQLRTI